MTRLQAYLSCFFMVLLLTGSLRAVERPETILNQEVGIFTELGRTVDLTLRFTSEQGEERPLSDFFLPGKPAVIVPVYFKCPRLCGLVLTGVMGVIQQLPLLVGVDFSVLAVSFNPQETSTDAGDSRKRFGLDSGGKPSEGWRFLRGSAESVEPLMASLGFKYLREGDDYAHSAAMMILTPTGKISQYFTGIEFAPRDVRLALVEASEGSIGTAVDHFLLYCFRFDPTQGKYVWVVTSMLRIGGLLTLAALTLFYGIFIYRRA